MRSPSAALLWDIWSRHRALVWVIAGLTVFSWLDLSDILNELLGMIAFVLLFAIFNYGEFPHRLFTLPVSSLRLVAVPVLAGIASVELVFLLWMERLPGGGPTSPLLVGVLLAAYMVCFQAVLWTLTRLGPLRLVVMGAIAVALFGIGLFPPVSQTVLTALIAGLTLAVFLLTWRHVDRLRSGGGRGGRWLGPLIGQVADAWPHRRRGFASPAAAHFWYEWRCAGLALPVLVAGVLLIVVAPFSWLARRDAGDSFQLLMGTLAMPIVLAIPVGMAFSKPTLWSDDLSVPAFVAVRPLGADDLVAIKMRVAAVSAAIAWLLVLAFLGVWWSSWANLDDVSRLALQLWALHRHSVAAVGGIAALIVIAGMFLTWRFLVSRLWSGLSGNRTWFVASTVSIALVAIAAVVFDGDRLPGWMLEDPERVATAVWIAALAVIAKYWLAAYAWRRIAPRHVRQYLLVWLAGTACFVTLGMLFWGVARMYVPMDAYRVQSVLLLLALLAVPLGRIGLAPSCLARNRHRS